MDAVTAGKPNGPSNSTKLAMSYGEQPADPFCPLLCAIPWLERSFSCWIKPAKRPNAMIIRAFCPTTHWLFKSIQPLQRVQATWWRRIHPQRHHRQGKFWNHKGRIQDIYLPWRLRYISAPIHVSPHSPLSSTLSTLWTQKIAPLQPSSFPTIKQATQ